MKKIKKILLVVILLCNYINEINAVNIKLVDITLTKKNQTNSLAEQVYNKLHVSTAIVEFTNDYVDSKKAENPGVNDTIWVNIKNSINYGVFKSNVIEVLTDNLTNQQLQQLINKFSTSPTIPLPTLEIRKEVAELLTSFNLSVDQTIASFI
jgi:hypothetical protein